MLPNGRSRLVLAAVAAALLAIGGGWYLLKPAPETLVEVSVKTSVCEKGGSHCYSLSVPGAKVTVIESGNPIAQGLTDDAGTVRLKVPGPASVEVVAESPVIEGGKVTHGNAFVSEGGMLSVSFSKTMSATMSPWGQ